VAQTEAPRRGASRPTRARAVSLSLVPLLPHQTLSRGPLPAFRFASLDVSEYSLSMAQRSKGSRVTMTMRMPAGLHSEVRRIAKEREVVMNDVLVEFLRRWVEHYGRRA
jgi:hypothetical protein